MERKIDYSLETNPDSLFFYPNKLAFNEAVDIVQKNSGQREPISNVIQRIQHCTERINELCHDIEESPAHSETDSESSSDIIMY